MNKIRFLLIFLFVGILLFFSWLMLSVVQKKMIDIVNEQKVQELRNIVSVLPNKINEIKEKEIEKLGLRLTLIDLDGNVIYDTLKDFSDTLLYKKEIKEQSAVREDQGKIWIYASKRIRDGFLRIGKMEDLSFLDFLKHDFIRYVFVGIFMIVLVILFFSSKILAPIKNIIQFAYHLKTGNYKARVHTEASKDLELLTKSLNQMAETIEDTHLELKIRQETIESVVKNIPVGIALLDNKGCLEVFNPKMEILLNQSLVPNRVYYENFFHSKIIEVVKESYATKNDVSQKIPMVNMERNAVYELFCQYLDGKVILMIMDITEKEKLNQLKSQFISDVTHEFKTPISIILGYLEVIEENTTQEHRNYIYKIKNSLNRLTEIINDLVKLEKIEYSSLFGGFSEIQLMVLIHKSIEILKPYAEKKNVQIILNIENVNLNVLGIEDIVYYCIYNILENSIKYNDKEKGLLDIRVHESSGKIIVSIADNGPGIPPEYREDIFRRFFRISKSRTTSSGQGGSGLGLSIVREGMRFHKGSVIAKDSPYGHGICFDLIFPKI